jgi:CRP/FNR family cyclic AMP-dependent transcriptional regulator
MAFSIEESGSGGAMRTSELGKVFGDGEIIVRQGEAGDVMFEILSGRVEVLQKREGQEVRLAILGKGDFFGEMAIFEREVRSATVRAFGEVRVLTIDKKILLRRINEDPSLALRILERMSHRIRELDNELVGLRTIVP